MEKARSIPGVILLCSLTVGIGLFLSVCALPTAPVPQAQVAAPSFFPPAGTYPSAQLVNISSSTADSVIRYTTDGTTPTSKVGTIYTAPISVGASQTIKAVAYHAGSKDSKVAVAAFAISGSVAAPTFSLAAGTYNNVQAVIISSTTAAASIRYTTDGTMPTASVGTLYSGPLSVQTSETVNAIAYKSGWLDSTVNAAAYVLQAATPAFDPTAGTYSSDREVAITSATSGAVIHYTTDGSPATPSSTQYTVPILVSGSGTNKTIRAIATLGGMLNSLAATSSYTINYSQVSTPNFSPAAGAYTIDQSVAIATDTAGAAIHFTTDGSTPTASSPLYTAPIAVAGDGAAVTITAYAIKGGMTASSVESATYTIGYLQVAAPNFDPGAGTYAGDQSVTISSATAGAVIHYTTDGSSPTAASPVYGGPVPVQGDGAAITISAYAARTGMTDSAVQSATYTVIYPQVAAPVLSPGEGTYASDQSVSIITATPGASIFYTTDGSAPTAASTPYSSPILVAGNGVVTTIRAIATNAGMSASSVAAATYAVYDTWQTLGALGSGPGQFHRPTDVAVDSSGRLYIADHDNNRIVRMNDMSGTGWISFGSQGSGAGQFDYPTGVTVDGSGHIYIADVRNNRIVRMDDMIGTNWTAVGTSGSAPKHFSSPAGVAVDSGGHVYVADAGNFRVVRMDDMTGAGWVTFGSGGTGANQFLSPSGIAVDAGLRVYVADAGNSRIVRMNDMSGAGWIALGINGSGTDQFDGPTGVALDAGGHIFVADWNNNRIVRMNDMSGTGWTVLGSAGSGINQFGNPSGIAIDAGGSVYVADGANNRIVRFVMQ